MPMARHAMATAPWRKVAICLLLLPDEAHQEDGAADAGGAHASNRQIGRGKNDEMGEDERIADGKPSERHATPQHEARRPVSPEQAEQEGSTDGARERAQEVDSGSHELLRDEACECAG